jgi:uncharacterized protein (TIGR03086 family)
VLDLEPATKTLAALVQGIDDEQLSAPTPCAATSLGDLLDHVDSLSLGFVASAAKTRSDGGAPPAPDASRLGPDWRQRIPGRLTELAQAWRDDGAWAGMTRAGGLDMPGEVVGVVALDEVIVHGWDVAVASGQEFEWDPVLVEAAMGFVAPLAEQNPQGVPGLFGPMVTVAGDAPLLDRLLGLTGRDPAWRPGGRDG